MKKHRIFNKGDRIYVLLSSHQEPNVLIPVAANIVDVKWDPVNPLYKIRITKFFDTLYFLKKYFLNMHFRYEFDKRARHVPINGEGLNRVSDLEEFINGDNRERFYVIVESVMCTKTSIQLRELFEKVQNFIISKKLQEIKELSSRSFYRGSLSVDSNKEWEARFKKGWEDKFKEPMSIQKYLKSLS